MTPPITVVFSGQYGFVSDLGGPVIARRSDDGVELPQYGLPRYGVWRMDRSKGKFQVVHVTEDLAEAVERAQQKDTTT